MTYIEEFNRQALKMVGKPPVIHCGRRKSICDVSLGNRDCRACVEKHFGIKDTLEDRDA